MLERSVERWLIFHRPDMHGSACNLSRELKSDRAYYTIRRCCGRMENSKIVIVFICKAMATIFM